MKYVCDVHPLLALFIGLALSSCSNSSFQPLPNQRLSFFVNQFEIHYTEAGEVVPNIQLHWNTNAKVMMRLNGVTFENRTLENPPRVRFRRHSTSDVSKQFRLFTAGEPGYTEEELHEFQKKYRNGYEEYFQRGQEKGFDKAYIALTSNLPEEPVLVVSYPDGETLSFLGGAHANLPDYYYTTLSFLNEKPLCIDPKNPIVKLKFAPQTFDNLRRDYELCVEGKLTCPEWKYPTPQEECNLLTTYWNHCKPRQEKYRGKLTMSGKCVDTGEIEAPPVE